MKTYTGYITELKENQVYVFGSNPVGINGNLSKGTGGAALFALKSGWIYQGEKLDNCLSRTGKAWGLTTVSYPGKKRSKTEAEIVKGISLLYLHALSNPKKEFLIAYTVSNKPNLNGYTTKEMANMFSMFNPTPDNIVFEYEFSKLLNVVSESESDVKILDRDFGHEFF